MSVPVSTVPVQAAAGKPAPDPCVAIADLCARAGTLTSILDSLTNGVVLVTEAARPILCNQRAQQILAARDGLSLRSDVLSTDLPRDTRALHHMVRAVALDQSCVRRLCIERPSGRPPLVVTASPANTVRPAHRGAQSTAVLFVREPDAHAVIDEIALADIYRLTGRESAVAAMIAGGKDPGRVAAALQIGVGTVRNHLKRVFDKMGVTRQSELVLLANAVAGAQP